MVGAWFSPGTRASSTTKTGRHDIAEILLKVALNTQKKLFRFYLKTSNIIIHSIDMCAIPATFVVPVPSQDMDFRRFCVQ
jgi:hypothetical protein